MRPGQRVRTRYGDRVVHSQGFPSHSRAVTDDFVLTRRRSVHSVDRTAIVSAGADLPGHRTEKGQDILLNNVLDRVDSQGPIGQVYSSLQAQEQAVLHVQSHVPCWPVFPIQKHGRHRA